MTSKKAEQTDRLRRNEEKWSPALMNAGWTVIPSVLLEKQAALGLDAIDLNILLHLAKHWWYRENPPHPSKISIAKDTTAEQLISVVRQDPNVLKSELERIKEKIQKDPFFVEVVANVDRYLKKVDNLKSK